MAPDRKLTSADAKLKRIEYESEKLLEAASIVLQSDEFIDAARAVFDIAKELTGAVSGYVALLSDDGSENEVLFLDSGGLPCYVDESLPMPIRGLREVAYREKRPAYDNSFMSSDWVRFMPEGHVVMKNVMFGPLIISDRAEGLIGLANKPTDFDEDDARIVMALSNLVAIGLKKAKMQEELKASQRSLSDTINELELYASLLRHDLSNDLQLIAGEIELVKMKYDLSPDLEGVCESISAASERMFRLLQVFTEAEFASEGKLEDILRYLVEDTVKSYPDAKIAIKSDLPMDSVKIRGRSLLPFVFDNIIRNAIQHVGPDVAIEVRGSLEHDKIALDFVDDGQGVDPSIVPNLFQRGDSGTSGGVGLYLCRKIVERYGGRIEYLNGVYEKGAAFRVELPLEAKTPKKLAH